MNVTERIRHQKAVGALKVLNEYHATTSCDECVFNLKEYYPEAISRRVCVMERVVHGEGLSDKDSQLVTKRLLSIINERSGHDVEDE